MAQVRPKARRATRETPRQSTRPTGDLGSEALRVIRDALGTILTVGTEVGTAAISTARGTVRVAGAVAAGVGRVGREVAEEALRVANRINGARDQVASGLGYSVPAPGEAQGSRLPEDALRSIGARRPSRKVRARDSHAMGRRKPGAKSPSRAAQLGVRSRGRGPVSRTTSARAADRAG